MHALEAEGLTRSIDGRAVVDGASLTLEPGETVVVSGPSGAGKTTLLRLLCRLDEPDCGALRVRGEDALAMPAPSLRRRVGYLHQRPDFPPGTVREHVAAGPRMRGEASDVAAVDAMLDALGLAPLADREARRLSVGERARTALGRLLLNGPDVLLLDEPTAHLDPDSARGVEEAVHAAAGRGVAVLWVSHDATQAQRGDRSLRMAAGRLS